MYKKEKIVNNLCNRNYHGMVNTFKEYLKFKLSFEEIKDKITKTLL